MRDAFRRVTVLAAALLALFPAAFLATFPAMGLIAASAIPPAGAAQDPCAANGGVDIVAPPGTRAAAQRCVTVPDVVGLDVDDARIFLKEAGLAAEVSDPTGEVGSSDPAAGTLVPRGSVVSLDIEISGPTPDPTTAPTPAPSPTPTPIPGTVVPEPDPRPGIPVADQLDPLPWLLVLVAVLAVLGLGLAGRGARRRSDRRRPPPAEPVVTLVPGESRSTITTDPGSAPTVSIAIEIQDADPHRELVRSRP